MSRPKGSIIGVSPVWTTTATSGIWTMRQSVEMTADGRWPRGPAAPTSLAGTAGNAQVALAWTAPANAHGTITGYDVEYTPAAGSPTVVATGSNAVSYTLTGLTNGTEYAIRVAGVNHTRGDWSSSVTVTPNSAPTDPYFSSVSLLLHFDGTNNSTTFTDSSPQNLTSQISTNGSPVVSTAQSKFGGSSLFLNATGFGGSPTPRLTLPDVSALNPESGDFTVECWVYPTVGAPSGGRNAPFAPPLYNPFTFGGLFERDLGTSDQSGVGVLTLNQWAFIAISRQGSSLYLYVDGVLKATISTSSSIGRLRRIGAGGDLISAPDPWEHFGGYIDEFRYTKGVCRYPNGTTFTPPTAAFPDA